jgi:hypothetical protein
VFPLPPSGPGGSAGGTTGGTGAGAGGSGGAGSLSLGPFCEEYADARCSHLVDCCNRANLSYDRASCVESERADCERSFANARNDPALAEGCLQAQQTLADCAWVSADFVDCVRILGSRDRQPGQSCAQHNDCAAQDGGVTSCLDGRCLLSPYTPEGTSCEALSVACAPGFGCLSRDLVGPRTCQRQLPLGAACADLSIGWCESQSCDFADTMTCVEFRAVTECPGFVR